MTINDITLLESRAVRESIETNLGCDPARAALNLGKHSEHAALIASQIKYLQRAQTKLPSYYDARCIIPARAFEQASSELVASQKHYSGNICVDLTCGLGVDTLHFTRNFEQVIAVERDPVLAEVARINFRRLGVDNVTVIDTSAEIFLAHYIHHVDLVYIDPDRRDTDGKRLVSPADCSPNVIELMPRLFELADKVVIKNSPLFDVDEALRIFGEECRLVEVISSENECREVLVECSRKGGEPIIRATSCERGSYECFRFQISDFKSQNSDCIDKCNSEIINLKSEIVNYLVVPDAALRAAHLVEEYFAPSFATEHGYAFCNELPENLMGKAYKVDAIMPYSPRQVCSWLQEHNIMRADIHISGVNITPAQVCRQLKIKEGGGANLFISEQGLVVGS